MNLHTRLSKAVLLLITCYNALSEKVEVLVQYKNVRNLNLVLKIKHGGHLISVQYISIEQNFLASYTHAC